MKTFNKIVVGIFALLGIFFILIEIAIPKSSIISQIISTYKNHTNNDLQTIERNKVLLTGQTATLSNLGDQLHIPLNKISWNQIKISFSSGGNINLLSNLVYNPSAKRYLGENRITLVDYKNWNQTFSGGCFIVSDRSVFPSKNTKDCGIFTLNPDTLQKPLDNKYLVLWFNNTHQSPLGNINVTTTPLQ